MFERKKEKNKRKWLKDIIRRYFLVHPAHFNLNQPSNPSILVSCAGSLVQKRNRCFLRPLQFSSVYGSTHFNAIIRCSATSSHPRKSPPHTSNSTFTAASSPASHAPFPSLANLDSKWPRSRRAVTQPETEHQPQSILTSDLGRHSWGPERGIDPVPCDMVYTCWDSSLVFFTCLGMCS